MKHKHRWGAWLGTSRLTRNLPPRKRKRLCINGWCPMGQYRNGRVFVARPKRRC